MASLALFFFFAVPQLAQSSEVVCAVPICDIASQVQNLSNGSTAQRFAAINHYRQLTSSLEDYASLDNLYHFSQAMRPIISNAQDPDWVLRECDGLSRSALNRILDNPTSLESMPVTNLISAFQRIQDVDLQYQIIRRWEVFLTQGVSRSRRQDLIQFFQGIVAHSTDYAQRESRTLLNGTLAQLVNPEQSIQDNTFYFGQISNSDLRADVVRRFTSFSADSETPARLLEIRAVLHSLLSASWAGIDNWVRALLIEALQRIALTLSMIPSQSGETLIAVFPELSENNLNSVIRFWMGQANQTSTLARAQEIHSYVTAALNSVTAQNTTANSEWIPRSLREAQISILARILTGPFVLSQQQLKQYFHGITSASGRGDVLDQWNIRIRNIRQNQELLFWREVFLYARDDSASFEPWVSDKARFGLDVIGLQLIRQSTSTLEHFSDYFSDLGSDARVAALQFWVSVAQSTSDATRLQAINQFFLGSIRACQTSPEWVLREAQASANISASRLVTAGRLDIAESLIFYNQITAQQSKTNVLNDLLTEFLRLQSADRNESLNRRIFIHNFFRESIAASRGLEDAAGVAHANFITTAVRLAQRPQIQADLMLSYFYSIDTDQARMNVLSFWQSRIRRYNDRNTLLELARFFYLAGINARQQLSSDEVINASRSSENEVNAKIVADNPFFEGTYELETRDASLAVQPITRLIIMNEYSAEGLTLALVNHDTGRTIFQFTNAQVSHGFTRFEALQATGARALSHILIDFNPQNFTIRGRISNSDSAQDFTFNARRTRTFDDLSTTRQRTVSERIAIDRLMRSWHGMVGGNVCNLTIRNFPELPGNRSTPSNRILGSLTFQNAPNLPFYFRTGFYDDRTGRISLLGNMPGGTGTLKLIMNINTQGIEGNLLANGLTLNTSDGIIQEVMFQGN